MASDINSVVLIGRLTRDAELKYTSSGTAICNLSIANNYSRKKGEEWVEEVSYFDATIIGRRAEALHKYLVKGKQIGIAGELQQDRWEKDGQKRSRVKVLVSDIQLLGGGQGSGRAADGTQPGDVGYSGSDFEDDVPF
jgi:single-strand DNA-binding protein